MKTIYTEKAPAAVGPYSQAVVINGLVYTSGQIALDPATGELVGTAIEEQAEQVMKNLVLAKRREEVLHDWVVKRIKSTYVRINDRYRNCNFEYEGWVR